MAKEIKDFGAKIGGARKDVWKLRGLMLEDLAEMNDVEQKKYIKKDNVWPKPNWESLIANGEDKMLCFWKNEVRKALPASPESIYGENKAERYVTFVSEMRDAVMAVASIDAIMSVYHGIIVNQGYAIPKYGRVMMTTEKGAGLVTTKLLKACVSATPSSLKRQKNYLTFGVPKQDVEYVICKSHMSKHCYDKLYTKFVFSRDRDCLMVKEGYSTSYYYPKECNEYSWTWKRDSWFIVDRYERKILCYNLATKDDADKKIEELAREATSTTEKKGKKARTQKKTFTVPKLDNPQRVGADWLNGEHASTERLMDTFGFYGGEFGEWLTTDEERQQHLDQAYDAFMDLSKVLGVSPKSMTFHGNLSIAFGSRGKGGSSAAAAHYEPLRQVINLTRMHGAGCLAHEWGHALDHYLAGVRTGQFPAPDMESDSYGRKNPVSFDSTYQKFGHGYWMSRCEMFARAFDCYILNRLKAAGMRNDYLTSHANGYALELEDGAHYAYPRGEERKRINEAFDNLIAALIASETI